MKAWPGWRARNSSSSNSRWVSAISSPASGHATRRRVDDEVAEPHRRLDAGRRVQPPQHGVDAGDELGRRERLDDVVVGAEPQPDDAVGLLAARGQQDDRRVVAGAASRTRRMTSRPSIPGSMRSSTMRSGAQLLDGRHRGVAVDREARAVAGALEVAADDLADRRLVVDDEDVAAGVVDVSPWRPCGRRAGGARALRKLARSSCRDPAAPRSRTRPCRRRTARAPWKPSRSAASVGAGEDVAHVAEPVVAGRHRRGRPRPRSRHAARAAISPTLRGVPLATLNAPGHGLAGGEREDVRAGDVAHVDEVAQLAAVLEDARRAAGRQRAGEDRRDAGVGRVARHPRPVDVVVAQRGDRHARLAAERRREVLLVQLRRGVDVARVRRRVLGDALRPQRRAAAAGRAARSGRRRGRRAGAGRAGPGRARRSA